MDIITTIGPASWSEDVIAAHVQSGVHCIRFPFAKETPEEHVERSLLVKRVAAELGRDVLTMADLPGGKPRLSNSTPQSILRERRYSIALTNSKREQADFFVDPPLLEGALQVNQIALIGDGENNFTVESVEDELVFGYFDSSFELERKRAFIPTGEYLSIQTFTEKDNEYVRFASKGKFDWIALSFVDSAKDIINIRQRINDEFRWRPHLIAKIETVVGVRKALEISAVSDSVMVGRGDLAVQAGLQHLWQAQKTILGACKSEGVYSIAATGFLESLNEHPFPSRSECIDICTALEMGANAIMLSAETTIGKRPIEAVNVLQTIYEGWRTGL